ncbi:hypothetical protein BV898_04961 [Hypsibius exemplaris]|uniref:Uncharacterized protein n=1 Tax=Hypsibius exemplaris TaxID=2072580 RepID=A0A1W0X1M4_HYPEX|nr:hypothetical protein BV898_04961 [Hypsibius exemplaris]
MPPVTRSRDRAAVTTTPSSPSPSSSSSQSQASLEHLASLHSLPPALDIPPLLRAPRRQQQQQQQPLYQSADSDVNFCDQIINNPHHPSVLQQQNARPSSNQIFHLTTAAGLQAVPLTFSAMHHYSGNVMPVTYTTAPGFGPMIGQREVVTLRPAGMAGQGIILYAEPPMAARQFQGVSQDSPNGAAPKTGMKHSLRLVRGATSAGWSVVPPPLGTVKSEVLPDNRVAGRQQPPTPVRARAKRPLPAAAAAPKATGKKQKKKSRALDSSLTRSSTSSESFRSDCLAADVSSHSGGSSNDDSKLTGADASLSSRQSSLSLDEPFGILPTYTQRQRDAMSAYFKGDMATANRYTLLKEWAFAKGTKFFQSGNIRLAMKSKVTALLYGAPQSDSVALSTVDELRDAVQMAMCDPRVDGFKRRLCMEIIRTRDPEYNIYAKKAAAEADRSAVPAEVSLAESTEASAS